MVKLSSNLQDFLSSYLIYKFDPEPDPHFRFLCEHGAWRWNIIKQDQCKSENWSCQAKLSSSNNNNDLLIKYLWKKQHVLGSILGMSRQCIYIVPANIKCHHSKGLILFEIRFHLNLPFYFSLCKETYIWPHVKKETKNEDRDQDQIYKLP